MPMSVPMSMSMRGVGTERSFPLLGWVPCAAAVAILALAASVTAAESYDARSGYGPDARAMSSYYAAYAAASSDPARSKAEIEAWHYNTDYLFGLSRGTADSALLPAFKPLVFLLTVPLDIALLPIAAIGGLFGG